MAELLQSVIEFLADSISDLLEWFLGFFQDIFTGQTIIKFGRAVLGIFLNGSFDFGIKSLFELLFGVAFLIFAIKFLVSLIRG